MFWFLRKRVDVLAEADGFTGSFGQHAYQEVRYALARAYERGDKARMKFLKRICKEIAKRADFDPGNDGRQSNPAKLLAETKGFFDDSEMNHRG